MMNTKKLVERTGHGHIKVLSWHSLEGTEESHRKHWSGELDSGYSFEPRIYQNEARVLTTQVLRLVEKQ
jgi:hypothetical protein